MLLIAPVQQSLVNALDDFNSRICAIEEKLLGLRVGEVEEQLAVGGLAIASGTPGFLISLVQPEPPPAALAVAEPVDVGPDAGVLELVLGTTGRDPAWRP